MPPEGVNVILEDVAQQFASDADIPEVPLSERLNLVVEYLDKQGYSARWESCAEGYILRTSNCPYHELARGEHTLCEMDMRLVSSLLGIVPRRLSHMQAGDLSCAYLIPASVELR
ncbi:MAG: hypothetical protein K8I30_18325 [Anaerolineae bacterium]|nr:hypothetical protein [Anaerolineae bacterium]